MSAALILIFWGAMFIGWVMNIFKIFGSMGETLTGKFVLRIIGIFVFPLGAIIGYF